MTPVEKIGQSLDDVEDIYYKELKNMLDRHSKVQLGNKTAKFAEYALAESTEIADFHIKKYGKSQESYDEREREFFNLSKNERFDVKDEEGLEGKDSSTAYWCSFKNVIDDLVKATNEDLKTVKKKIYKEMLQENVEIGKNVQEKSGKNLSINTFRYKSELKKDFPKNITESQYTSLEEYINAITKNNSKETWSLSK